MRKILLLCTLILCLLCASAGAEGALNPFYDAQTALLTSTDNVTLNIGAVFELDGVQFKQMTFGEAMNGDTSVRDLIMVTPRANGEERISGFTVFADGSNIYAFETADAAGGEYVEKYFDDPSEKTAILRRRPLTDSLVEMGRSLLPVIEAGTAWNWLPIRSSSRSRLPSWAPGTCRRSTCTSTRKTRSPWTGGSP